jgi:hypothetical protein
MNEMLTKLKAAVTYLRRIAFEVADAYFDYRVTPTEYMALYHKYSEQLHKVSQMLDYDEVQDYIEHVDYADTYSDCGIQYITVEYNA